MYDIEQLRRARAAERRERQAARTSERDRFVTFDEWTLHARGIADPFDVPQTARNYLYREYQSDMIRMGFHEWQRAVVWGVSPFYDLFG